METVRLAILGAASVRCAVPVLASLGNYFGERPMEIALYDADAERLDLFCSFARTVFATNKNPYIVTASMNAAEVLDGAAKVVLQLDANCSLKEAKRAGAKIQESLSERISDSLTRLLPDVPSDAQVMCLQSTEVRVPLNYYYRLDWPAEPTQDELRSLPHQVLRWIRGEEYVFDLLREHERSPFKRWLDDVSVATVVSEG